MSSAGSVTAWIEQLKHGDQLAAQKLWETYFLRLVGLARKKLQGARRRAEDEEDVALVAFNSVCAGAEKGKFPRLHDREDLLQLLMVITAHKASDARKWDEAQKRGGGEVRGESAFLGPNDHLSAPGIEQVIGAEPTPAFAAQLAEDAQRLLDRLKDDDLVRVAVWKMEGQTNEEIAKLLGCVPRSVTRKLNLIRKIWEREASDARSK